MAKTSIPREEKGGGRKRRQRGGAPSGSRGKATLLCWPPFPFYPPNLPLKTKIPLRAEIKLEGP